MKKQVLLMAGCILVLASCGSNNTSQTQTMSQVQIDSMVNAKLAQHDSESTAKREERERAAKERHDEKRQEDASSAPATTAPDATPAKTAQDNKFDSRQPANQNKATLTPDQQKAQDDKFNNRGGR